jgi:L-asparaginase
MKKILLITTGGTIACSPSDSGLTPSVSAEQLLAHVPEISPLCQIEALSLMSIDSTNMTPQLMAEIAECLYNNVKDYDGFVVTHGTDTLGYTAAALTYMLPGIAKPVVVTGSQLAIEEIGTDAKTNLADAIHFALEGSAGIFVAFDGKIINGTRAKKIRTQSMDAFASINFPLIAEVMRGRVSYNNSLNNGEYADSLKQKCPLFSLKNRFDDSVFLLKLTPCSKPELLLSLKESYRGLVIEGFGIGGIPGNLLGAIEELIRAGVTLVISTQCHEEGIDLGIYEVGQNLAKYDVISAGDMSSEAVTMKLMWALGNYATLSQVKTFIETPIQGDRCR